MKFCKSQPADERTHSMKFITVIVRSPTQPLSRNVTRACVAWRDQTTGTKENSFPVAVRLRVSLANIQIFFARTGNSRSNVWEPPRCFSNANTERLFVYNNNFKVFFQVLFTTTSFSSVLSCEDLLISSLHRSANMWIFIYLNSSFTWMFICTQFIDQLPVGLAPVSQRSWVQIPYGPEFFSGPIYNY